MVVVVVVVRSGGRQYKRLAWPSFTHDRNLTWSRFGLRLSPDRLYLRHFRQFNLHGEAGKDMHGSKMHFVFFDNPFKPKTQNLNPEPSEAQSPQILPLSLNPS